MASLRTEQEEVSLQLNTVNSEIVSAELSGSVSAGAITDPAVSIAGASF